MLKVLRAMRFEDSQRWPPGAASYELPRMRQMATCPRRYPLTHATVSSRVFSGGEKHGAPNTQGLTRAGPLSSRKLARRRGPPHGSGRAGVGGRRNTDD